ncbi:MAG TPA: hypothetical protein DCR14_01435 [Acidimicrobiaceae bacterium]|nr:hypothetical protein [Acidimicrobiaceae bacterium]
MRTTRSTGRRHGRLVAAALISLGLVAASCSDKKDDEGGGGGTEETDGGGGDTTVASTTPIVTDPPITEPPVEASYGGSIVVAGEAEVSSPWTPAAMQCDSFCQMRARTFYDPLITVDNDLNWKPYLAESIEPNADNTVFTIKIREGIKFHDGSDVNADAVMFNLNATGSGLLVSAGVKDLARDPACWTAEGGLANLACKLVMEKVDDYTFTIATGFNGDASQPLSWPLFPYYLGGQFGLIASQQWLEAVAAGTAQPDEPVGSGPFKFQEYSPGEGGKLVVVRNEDYWHSDAAGNQLPFLDQIEFRVISDSAVRAQALESGDVDIIASSDAAVVSDYDPDFSGYDGEFILNRQAEYSETNYILLHLSKEGSPLQDRDFRCALLQAIDKQDLIDTIANGYPAPANGPFSPGQEGHLADNGSLPYDPDAAADAIAAYEAANGEVTINYSTTTSATSLATAEYLQGVWGDVGVDVTIDQIEQSKLINNALFGDPAFDAFGWRNHAGLFVDSQYFWWHGSAALPDGSLALNFGRLDDPVINELLEKSRSESDPEVRRGYAEDINRQFASECWIIPTSFTTWGVIYNPRVQGIGTLPQPSGEGFVRDGAGFSGQVWLTSVFVSEG